MESRWKDKLATELSKAQEEAMEKMSQLKLNFEEQATLLNSKHNGKMEEMRNHFKAEIEKMNGAVRSYEQTHERLKNEISERDSLVKDLKNANNLSLDRCLQAENNLELMRHKMDNKSRDLESVEEWKNRYEAEIKLLKEKLNEGSYRQRDLEREVNGARDGKQVVSLRNEQLEREREGFEARIKELGLEIASLEGEKIKLQGLVQSVNSDHTAFIDQQAADLKLARRELSEKDIETAELKNKLKEASEAHQSTLAAYEERIRCLKESMGNDTDLKKKIDELQKINMEKQTQLMQQKASIEDLFNLNGKLESELNASKSKIQSFAEELKRVKGENANLLESLKTSEELSMRREAELKRVQLEIELLKKAQDEVSRKGMLVSEYQSNLRSLGDELNETQNKLKEVLERNNEKELQVSTLQTKIHDHAMTIKRGNEEYKNLEKEVFELRELKPLKKEIINSSIQQNILREEITSKEKLILVLNGELEGMREGLMKKCKEMEELSVNFKKVIEDVKEKKSEDLKKSTVEFAERLRLKEAELTKAQDEKERMEKEQKQHYEGQIARNEERIAQLMKDSEAKETDILNERNLTIAKLSHELKMKEDELFRVVQDWQEQVNDVKREDQQTLEQCRADLEKIIYEKEEELKKSRREAATLEKDLEREKSSKKSVEGELDGLRKRISELEAKLAENKEKTTQFEKVIRDLLLANQQLSSKLNEHNQLSKQLIKRTQNSIPRTNSNQKSHLPDQSGQPKPNARVSSFDEKNVDNNLLVKFEGQQVVGGVKPDPRNKENQNTINHQSSKVPIEGKVRRESYERVLQERVVPVDPKSRVEGSLRNSGYSNQTQPFASTPSKLISDQQGSVLGLHQVEDLKQYSSRYSRRSPTPHKHQETPLTFNGQSEQVQPFSHL
jgi:chromosome segregation ATPase